MLWLQPWNRKTMAETDYFVDPNAGDDGTGDGSVGTPWRTIQHALDTITRDGTNGDQINIKAGTADVLTASLSLATYGTPTNTARLVFRGYTSAADDGGIGEIDGNATYRILAATTYDFLTFRDLKIGNTGANLILHADAQTVVDNCELHTGTVQAVYISSGVITNSWIHDTASSYALSGGAGLVVVGNFIDSKSTIAITGPKVTVNNIVKMNTACTTGISVPLSGICVGNTIFDANGGTSNKGITASWYTTVINNLIVDNNGASAIGINLTAANPAHTVCGNGFHDCTTEVVETSAQVAKSNNTISAEPFTDSANQDFTPTSDVSAVYPTLYRGSDDGANTGTTTQAQVGAAQVISAGGGGLLRVGMSGGFSG